VIGDSCGSETITRACIRYAKQAWTAQYGPEYLTRLGVSEIALDRSVACDFESYKQGFED